MAGSPCLCRCRLLSFVVRNTGKLGWVESSRGFSAKTDESLRQPVTSRILEPALQVPLPIKTDVSQTDFVGSQTAAKPNGRGESVSSATVQGKFEDWIF